MGRREYAIHLTVNGRKITKVVIDPHYELKHSDSINDALIVELVKRLDKLEMHGKSYKLIWLLEKNEIYIGIVNAYRRK